MPEGKKQCLFVIGMHRCGTSALAGSLHQLGYHIGASIMSPTEFNAKGYFENMAVFHFNEALLEELGGSWDNTPANIEVQLQDRWEEYQRDIYQIIEKEYNNQPHILIKDPRISLLTALWHEALTHLGYDCYFLICYRNPLKVLQSLKRRDNFSYEKSSFLYAQYLRSALDNTYPEDSCLVHYEHLIKEKSNFITSLGPIQLKSNDEIRQTIDGFLDRGLGHDFEKGVQLVSPRFPAYLYEALQKKDNHALASIFARIDDMKPSHRDTEVSILGLELKNLETELLEEKALSLTLKEEYEKKANKDEKIREAQFIAISKQTEQSRNTVNNLRIEKENLVKEFNEKINEIEEYNITLNDRLSQQKEEYTSMLELGNILIEEEILDQEKEIQRKEEKIFSMQQSIQEIQKEKAIQSARFEASNNELRESNEELERIVKQKKKEVQDVRTSVSSRLGFAISYPFRLIYELTRLVNIRTIQLIPTFVIRLIRNPQMAFAALKPHNLEKLRMATAVENSKLTKKNISKYFNHLDDIQSIGDTESNSNILWKIDEAGKFGSTLIIRGWAISHQGVKVVAIKIKDSWIPMEYGRNRPDIAIVYPNYQESDNSEFYYKNEFLSADNFVEIRIVNNEEEELIKTIQLKSLMDWSSLELNEQYEEFLKRDKTKRSSPNEIFDQIEKFDYKPKVSIIVPVYNVEAKWLRLCIQSVRNQLYKDWELCIYDDASTSQATIKELKEWEGTDLRIKIKYGFSNVHISESSNQAILMCQGAYVGLLDHDDELTPDALFQVVRELNKSPELLLIYSDEDKKELDGRRVDPHFKSDFNLDLIRSNNYIAHFCVIKKSIGDKVGWFTKGLEGSQDHDLVLKVIDHIRVEQIKHIPKVLYHWRKIPGSTAALYEDKDYAFNAGKKALENHLDRNDTQGQVEKGIWPGSYKVNYVSSTSPLVSVIIPFKDQVHLLKDCLRSIAEKTNYKNYEILLINNGSDESATRSYLDSIKAKSKISVLDYNIPFNYSKINNWAVERANGELILLLNNDIAVISESWLTHMASFFTREEIGAVGAKLLYEDDTIQHAGVIMGIGGVAGHSHKYLHDEGPGYFSRHQTIQNLSACTAACIMVRKDLFDQVGGLDEDNLTVAFNDVDLCLKLRKLGKLIVYTPYAALYHYESKSRGQENTPSKLKRFKKEIKYFQEKWENILLQGDEYYNPNLSLTRENFSLKLDE